MTYWFVELHYPTGSDITYPVDGKPEAETFAARGLAAGALTATIITREGNSPFDAVAKGCGVGSRASAPGRGNAPQVPAGTPQQM